MPIDYIAQAATKTVEDCLEAVYVNPDDPSVFKQFKSTGCFQPFRTPSQGDGDIYAKKPDGTVLSDKVYKFIEGYAIEKGADFCDWIYQLFKTVEFSLSNSADHFAVDGAAEYFPIFSGVFICPKTYDEDENYLTGIKNVSLEDMGDYFKDTLWQCAANNPFTSNRYGLTPFSYADARSNGDDFAFADFYAVEDMSDLSDTDKKEFIGFTYKPSIQRDKVTNAYCDRFGNGGSSLKQNAINKVNAILQRLNLHHYSDWAEIDDRKASFKKLMGYVMFHSAYDCRMKIQNETPEEDNYGSYAFDAKFGSSKAPNTGEYAFTPSAEKMLDVLYFQPWVTLPNDAGDNRIYLPSSGYPRINMSMVTDDNKYPLQNNLMTKYYALGRCDAFAELGKLFCDVIDLYYGVNIRAKYIEATCGNHAWFMANIDGAFKFFDLCPYCTKSNITSAGLLDRNDIRAGGSHYDTNSEWGTYNIDVETMIDPAFAATVGYSGVYDEGNFKMQPIAEPLDPNDTYYNDNYDSKSSEFRDTYEYALANASRLVNVNQNEDAFVYVKSEPYEVDFFVSVGDILTYVYIENDDISHVYPMPLSEIYELAKGFREDTWNDGAPWAGESLEGFFDLWIESGRTEEDYEERVQKGLNAINNSPDKFIEMFIENFDFLNSMADADYIYEMYGIDPYDDNAFEQLLPILKSLITAEIDYDLQSLAFPNDDGYIPLDIFGIYFGDKREINFFMVDVKLDDNKWYSIFASPAIDATISAIILNELWWFNDNKQVNISSDFGVINSILEDPEYGFAQDNIPPVLSNDDVSVFINNLNSLFEAHEINAVVYQANRDFFAQNTFAAKFFSMLKGMDITLTSDLGETEITTGKIIDVRPCNIPLCFGGEPDTPQSNITLNEFLAWAAEHGIQVALLPGVHYGVDGIEALQHSSM